MVVQVQPHAEESNCVHEFGQCVMNRDCCNFNKDDASSLECVAGDWAVTTDFTCLSSRSKILEQLSRDEKINVLKDFYDNKVYPPWSRKPTSEVVKLYEKFSKSFANLVLRLEKKYKVSLVDNIKDQQKVEL